MKTDKECWISVNVNPGVIYTYIKTPWLSSVDEFSFSVYGNEKV